MGADTRRFYVHSGLVTPGQARRWQVRVGLSGERSALALVMGLSAGVPSARFLRLPTGVRDERPQNRVPCPGWFTPR